MEIAILVFFLAIFGGILFLIFLIWFFLRRRRRPRSFASNHQGNAGAMYGASSAIHQSDDGIESNLASYQAYGEESAEGQARETVGSQNFESVTAETSAAGPAEPSYYESSYDSGSSSDSSSSSDNGSSSSSD